MVFTVNAVDVSGVFFFSSDITASVLTASDVNIISNVDEWGRLLWGLLCPIGHSVFVQGISKYNQR